MSWTWWLCACHMLKKQLIFLMTQTVVIIKVHVLINHYQGQIDITQYCNELHTDQLKDF